MKHPHFSETSLIVAPIVFLLAWIFNACRLGKFKQLRDAYVVGQVQRLRLPEFPAAPVRRYRITFSGRVQKVGFRLAVCQLAERLGLTGFCQNLDDGSVLAELQGTEEKIRYLLSFLESRKRIKIRHKTVEPLDVLSDETGFIKL